MHGWQNNRRRRRNGKWWANEQEQWHGRKPDPSECLETAVINELQRVNKSGKLQSQIKIPAIAQDIQDIPGAVVFEIIAELEELCSKATVWDPTTWVRNRAAEARAEEVPFSPQESDEEPPTKVSKTEGDDVEIASLSKGSSRPRSPVLSRRPAPETPAACFSTPSGSFAPSGRPQPQTPADCLPPARGHGPAPQTPAVCLRGASSSTAPQTPAGCRPPPESRRPMPQTPASCLANHSGRSPVPQTPAGCFAPPPRAKRPIPHTPAACCGAGAAGSMPQTPAVCFASAAHEERFAPGTPPPSAPFSPVGAPFSPPLGNAGAPCTPPPGTAPRFAGAGPSAPGIDLAGVATPPGYAPRTPTW
mmetsp:Transcript_66099/g.123297  ORF Transcript_66099/g.123297 Transcript_66099/m.123297 type:complete len:361 (-) Transcript_66099:305-1387(-)